MPTPMKSTTICNGNGVDAVSRVRLALLLLLLVAVAVVVVLRERMANPLQMIRNSMLRSLAQALSKNRNQQVDFSTMIEEFANQSISHQYNINKSKS
jgi:hypothetical protein